MANVTESLAQDSPVAAAAASVINAEPSAKVDEPMMNKSKDAKPTTGETGANAEVAERTHR